MTERTGASWLVYALGALCAGAIAAAILVVGPASGNQSRQTRTATVAQGVVQSTVSGSGNLRAASQLNVGFKTSGTITHISVTQGEQVVRGQLLATLDPQSAEVTLEQAKATLQSAEANLAKQEETNGEGSTGQATTGSGTGGAATAPEPASKKTGAAKSSPSSSSSTTSSSSSSSATVSPATREANLASAEAAVKSDKLSVHSDEQAVQDTKLYAPADGTIASLSGQVGENVTAAGTTRATSAGGSSSGSGSAAAAGSASSAGAKSSSGSTGSSSASGSSGSSSSSFAILSDLSSMQLVVPLSESEVGHVKNGQIATVTVEALESRKLAAHVSEVAILSTSNSGVVSYDVTFQLDQMQPGLKPGMSATAEVVVRQSEGVNVPTTAISAGGVTVIQNGKQVRRQVVTGLAGNSSTIILSGLRPGEQVVLPSTTTTTGSSPGSRRGGAPGGGLGGGLGGGATGFPGGAIFRGGG